MYPNRKAIEVCKTYHSDIPPQCQQRNPGIEAIMVPRPISEDPNYVGSGKLKDKVAIVTGGDSGIGKAVAIAFAKEGADVAIVYLCPYEQVDAEETKKRIESLGRRCLLIQGNLGIEAFCYEVARRTIEKFGHIDILVNNAAAQMLQNSIENISSHQLEVVFHTNIIAFFHLTKAALPYMKRGSAIINTSSIAAYIGIPQLLDYSATKGAIISFTRSLALSLVDKGIRVNAVSPGPVWTPAIPSSFPPDQIPLFGRENSPIGRPAQPYEMAPAYVFLACERDSSYVIGETIHITGGMFVSG